MSWCDGAVSRLAGSSRAPAWLQAVRVQVEGEPPVAFLFHELLKEPHKDVVNSRLAAASFPPWPDGTADDTADNFVAEDTWAQWRARLHRAWDVKSGP